MKKVALITTCATISILPGNGGVTAVDDATAAAAASGLSSNSVVKDVLEVSDHITVESCFDNSTKMMDMSVYFHNIEPTSDGLLPWMSVGYRSSEVCAMIPPEVGVAPIILVAQTGEDGMLEAHKTELFAGAKRFNEDDILSSYGLMKPLEEDYDYAGVFVEAPMISSDVMIARSSVPASLISEDTVSLHFKQAVKTSENSLPDAMNLMYAIGLDSKLGVHRERGCFQIKPTMCQQSETIEIDLGGGEEKNSRGGMIFQAPSAESSASRIPSFGFVLASFSTLSTVLMEM